MTRVVISTSSSGLDNLNIQHNIELIRLRLHISNIEFIDGRNITQERLQYIMNDVARTAVHTSPAPKAEVENLLTSLYNQNCTEVLIVTLSSRMSESFHIINQVAKSFKDKMRVHVYDCKNVNICEAMLALEAEQMMIQGFSLEDIIARLDKLRQNHKMLFAVNDISHLIRNKKLTPTKGFLANLLNIKPVLEVNERGEIIPVNQVRRISKTFDYIIDSMAESVHKHDSFPYVLTAGDKSLTDYFVKRVKKELYLDYVPVLPVSSISMANHGPSAVGLCVFEDVIPQAAKFYTQG